MWDGRVGSRPTKIRLPRLDGAALLCLFCGCQPSSALSVSLKSRIILPVHRLAHTVSVGVIRKTEYTARLAHSRQMSAVFPGIGLCAVARQVARPVITEIRHIGVSVADICFQCSYK